MTDEMARGLLLTVLAVLHDFLLPLQARAAAAPADADKLRVQHGTALDLHIYRESIKLMNLIAYVLNNWKDPLAPQLVVLMNTRHEVDGLQSNPPDYGRVAGGWISIVDQAMKLLDRRVLHESRINFARPPVE